MFLGFLGLSPAKKVVWQEIARIFWDLQPETLIYHAAFTFIERR